MAKNIRDAMAAIVDAIDDTAITLPEAQTIKTIYARVPGSGPLDTPSVVLLGPRLMSTRRPMQGLRERKWEVTVRLVVRMEKVSEAHDHAVSWYEALANKLDSNLLALAATCERLEGPTGGDPSDWEFGGKHYTTVDMVLGLLYQDNVTYS